jgi:hypothetical protein
VAVAGIAEAMTGCAALPTDADGPPGAILAFPIDNGLDVREPADAAGRGDADACATTGRGVATTAWAITGVACTGTACTVTAFIALVATTSRCTRVVSRLAASRCDRLTASARYPGVPSPMSSSAQGSVCQPQTKYARGQFMQNKTRETAEQKAGGSVAK